MAAEIGGSHREALTVALGVGVATFDDQPERRWLYVVTALSAALPAAMDPAHWSVSQPPRECSKDWAPRRDERTRCGARVTHAIVVPLEVVPEIARDIAEKGLAASVH